MGFVELEEAIQITLRFSLSASLAGTIDSFSSPAGHDICGRPCQITSLSVLSLLLGVATSGKIHSGQL